MDQSAKAQLDEKLVNGDLTTEDYQQAIQGLVAQTAAATVQATEVAHNVAPPPLPTNRRLSPLVASKDEPFTISRFSFRFLVLIAGGTSILGTLAGFLYGSSLPPEIGEYLANNTGVSAPAFTTLALVALIVLIPTYAWSLIGLWNFRSSARPLLVIVMLVGYATALFSPASVVSGLELLLVDTGAMATACVLTLAYWGPAKQWFA